MPTSVRLRSAVLAALDPAEGGRPSGDLDFIRGELARQGVGATESAIRAAVDELVEDRRVEAVVAEDGSTVLTRADVLLRGPGVLSALRPPAPGPAGEAGSRSEPPGSGNRPKDGRRSRADAHSPRGA